MKKIMKSRIFLVILTAIIVSSVTVYAVNTYNASQIEYNKNGKATVENALDDLYEHSVRFNILDSNRAQYTLPTSVKKAYIIVSRGTSNIPYTITISGTGIISKENISSTNRADVNMAVYIDIYKIELNGENGNIALTKSGGSAASQAWNAVAIY